MSKLSKDEVDALLIGVDDGDVNTNIENQQPDEVKELDFFNQERVIRSQFPVLERLHERFAKKLMSTIYDLMSREVEVNIASVKVLKSSEFMAQLKMPTAMNIVRYHPLRGKAILLFDEDMVFTLVENYFGGDGRFKSNIEEREFTQSELRIVNIILKTMIADLESVWKPIHQVNIEVVSTEMNPQLVGIASANELMITTNLEINFNEYGGVFTIAMPYGMLDPIKEQLDVGTGRADEDVDPNWTKSLQEEILDVPLEVSSELTKARISLKQLMHIKAGDVIPIEMPETVVVDIAGIPSFRAKYGMSNDKCSLKITEKIDR